jgi:hypothetical protein
MLFVYGNYGFIVLIILALWNLLISSSNFQSQLLFSNFDSSNEMTKLTEKCWIRTDGQRTSRCVRVRFRRYLLASGNPFNSKNDFLHFFSYKLSVYLIASKIVFHTIKKCFFLFCGLQILLFIYKQYLFEVYLFEKISNGFIFLNVFLVINYFDSDSII